ncbi:MAG: PH domain-containing protein [Acidimicrobiia bacterium]
MSGEPGPVYRATTGNRAAAAILLAAAISAVGFVIVNWKGFIVVAACVALAVVAFLALSALRFCVRADPDHLVVCGGGGRSKRIPWSQIKGFGVGGPKGRDVFVELADKRKIRLPLVEVTNQRASPTEVRDALQRYWRAHRR